MNRTGDEGNAHMTRKRLLSLLALGLACPALAACVPDQRTAGLNTGYQQQGYGQHSGYPRGYGQQACDTTIRVVNRSRGAVYSLFISHSSRQGWGQDRLGQNQIPPGGAMSFRPSAAGPTDFRVVFSNGSATELRQVDVCRASEITVTNRGLRVS